MLGYERDTFGRATVDLGLGAGAARQEGPDLQGPHRAARQLDDRPRRRRPRCSARARRTIRPKYARGARPGRAWSGTSSNGSTDAPRLECDWEPLPRDLPAQPGRPRGAALLAADRRRAEPARRGLPWFMTMFGRDSIFTSLQALPFTPELAATTLRALGDWQGTPARRLPRRGSRPDPARDALRRADGVRGAAALAVLRLAPMRRRSTWCCSTSTSAGPATGSWSATSSTRPGPRSTGSTSTPT